MGIGDRIKLRRKELGMSAEALADCIGKSAATVYRYENGDISKVGSEVLLPIADALRTTPAFLMGWDNDAPSTDESNNPLEIELIQIFRDLNATGQQTLMGTARGLHANPDMKRGSEQNPTAI